MGGVRPIDLWNQWAIQILVLLSFTLQVVLLLLAGIRRRKAPTVLRFLLWLAYQLADSTAIYALGHLSLSSTPSRDHQLVAFWAPFLLLHLGGPDNITAYALEDNKLWQRHLLTLVVQVLGAAYVLYKHTDASVLLAAFLMFVAGVLKYGERTWALKSANLGSIRSWLRKKPPAKHYVYPEYDKVDLSQSQVFKGDLHEEEEVLLRRAHSVFHVCLRAAVDSALDTDPDSSDKRLLRYEWKTMWRLVEMELSLLYDILYTKAAVIHTWSGYTIRVFTLGATVSSFLLFWFNLKPGHNSVDIAITYTLLAGAFFLELTSLLNALGSSWTLAFLYYTRWSWLHHEALCRGRWDRFRHKVVSLRRFLKLNIIASHESRRWSGTMGQYNMLGFCSRGTGGPIGWLMQVLGFEEWWNKKHYSWSIEIPENVKQLMHNHVLHQIHEKVNTIGVLRKSWGDEALANHADLQWYLGVELSEGILMWHIGTDIFLIRRRKQRMVDGHHSEDTDGIVREIEAISNYMMFLLVRHPYMLPGLALNRLYQVTCDDMAKVWHAHKKSGSTLDSDISDGHVKTGLLKRLFGLHGEAEREKLARVLYNNGGTTFSHKTPRLPFAISLAYKLCQKEDEKILKVVLQVWMEILFYAANRCSGESHAKKINSGSELTTFLWLMAENFHHYLRMQHVAI